jgi:hypothetical protein
MGGLKKNKRFRFQFFSQKFDPAKNPPVSGTGASRTDHLAAMSTQRKRTSTAIVVGVVLFYVSDPFGYILTSYARVCALGETRNRHRNVVACPRFHSMVHLFDGSLFF